MTASALTHKRRKGLLASASVAAVLGLSACGGGDAAAYCDSLQRHADELADLATANPQAPYCAARDGKVTMMAEAGSDVPEETSEEHAAVQEILEELNSIDLEAMMDVESMMEMDQDEGAEMEAEIESMEQRFQELEEDGQRWGDWVDENCDIEDPLN